MLRKRKKRARTQQNFKLDYMALSQMKYNMDEPVEEKIAKQALMEAMFETQIWQEPYVKNPFIYITDHDSDFQGEDGEKLHEYFKKVFLSQYKKYREIVTKHTP